MSNYHDVPKSEFQIPKNSRTNETNYSSYIGSGTIRITHWFVNVPSGFLKINSQKLSKVHYFSLHYVFPQYKTYIQIVNT